MDLLQNEQKAKVPPLKVVFSPPRSVNQPFGRTAMRNHYQLICLCLATFLMPQGLDAVEWTAVAPHEQSTENEIVLIQHEQPVPRPLALQLTEPNMLDSQQVQLASAESDYVYLPEGASPAVVVPYDNSTMEDCFVEPQPRSPRFGVFGDYLYLSPRDADVAYAVPQDGIGPGATPMGEVATVDPQFAHGIRFGAFFALGHAAKIRGTYTRYENSSDSSVTADAPLVINPLVMYPGTFGAGFTAQEASASSDIKFQFIDLDYEVVSMTCEDFWVGYFVGARYGQLDQTFNATFPFALPNGTTTVNSAINFDGIGLRGGVQGERSIFYNRGFRIYGHGILSLMAGQFSSSYVQQNQFNGVEVNTAFSEDRIVPIVDLEAGIAWVSAKNRFRVSGGYMISAWYNTVTTPAWIQGVQQQDFTSVKDRLTFDGLVARAEVSF
jgi:hypothetical protein